MAKVQIGNAKQNDQKVGWGFYLAKETAVDMTKRV